MISFDEEMYNEVPTEINYSAYSLTGKKEQKQN
jgi:hypothetical protein